MNGIYRGTPALYTHSNGLGIFLSYSLDRNGHEIIFRINPVEPIHEQAFWFREEEGVDQNWIQHRY